MRPLKDKQDWMIICFRGPKNTMVKLSQLKSVQVQTAQNGADNGRHYPHKIKTG
jgi:hypothetical protein